MILLTGGAGFIGSHTAVELLSVGYDVVVLDDLSNSSFEVIDRIEKIAGVRPKFVQGDVKDVVVLNKVFGEYPIKGVMHFAGLKAVGDSFKYPLEYYSENVVGTCVLLSVMQAFGVYNVVFSSSATVYKPSDVMPLSEQAEVGEQSNPYGRTKAVVEKILADLALSDPRWSIAILRYFNPIGAHRSGLLGEAPNGVPNNLVPYITKVLTGKLEKLHVFGNDFDTEDGTGVRDYIHVEDLSLGHLKAYEFLKHHPGVNVWNLGTGIGHSVFDVVHAFERVTGRSIPYEISARREGDIARCWANPSKALVDLEWKAERTLEDMVRDAWRWAQYNLD